MFLNSKDSIYNFIKCEEKKKIMNRDNRVNFIWGVKHIILISHHEKLSKIISQINYTPQKKI